MINIKYSIFGLHFFDEITLSLLVIHLSVLPL